MKEDTDLLKDQKTKHPVNTARSNPAQIDSGSAKEKPAAKPQVDLPIPSHVVGISTH